MAEIYDAVKTWANNFQRNVGQSFSNMTAEKYIRLVAVVGAYALLRPYIMKLGAKLQTREHEKELDAGEMAAAEAAISPNSLRGQIEVPDDSDDDEAVVPEPNWGKKARKRQRQLVRKVLEAEEKLRREEQEDDEDKDIQEFLVD